MKSMIKSTGTILAATLSLSACGLLDVNNPNNLVESSIEQTSAAAAVVNGSQALAAQAIGYIWSPLLVATDEFTWIGSRDAWGSLDQGFVSDASNEFTDAAYPYLAQARWMADRAVAILEEHVAEDASFSDELARAHLYAGLVYMIVGEVQQDFTISDKRESGPPVGPDQMYTMLDDAITHLDAAISGTTDDEVKLQGTALRARAKQSRAIWDKIKPSPNTGAPLVSSSGAVADALAVISMAGGVTADWNYDLHYSASTVGNDLAFEANSRKENQVDHSLVSFTADNDIDQIITMDPIDNIPDPAFERILAHFKDGAFNSKGSQYAPNTVASTRLMHLILAEDALANGDMDGFTTHINHVRAMDDLTPYSGQVDAMELLQYERRINTFAMGLRLSDMYRFGVTDTHWQSVSDAIKAPGTLLPITLVEVRANCYLNGLGC